MTAPWQPPSDIWEVNQSLRLDEHLDGDRDPRWVDTERARGEYSLTHLCRALGVDRTRRRSIMPNMTVSMMHQCIRRLGEWRLSFGEC